MSLILKRGFTHALSFNPNAGSFNPNAGSFQPGSGGVPPFRPGQQYNPYAPPQQPGPDGNQYYNPYAQQQQHYGYGQQPGGFGYGGQPAASFGANDPFARQNNGPGGFQQQQPNAFGNNSGGFGRGAPQQREQQVYQPPVRNTEPKPNVPFSRAEADPSAPAPAKPPTMSLKIGGAKQDKPATVSLSIGGNKGSSTSAAKSNPPANNSKDASPASSKPGTPAPGDKPAAAAAKVSTPAVKAAKKDDEAPKSKAEVKKDATAAKAENSKTADAISAEVAAHVDEDTLTDLYGDAPKDIKPHVNVVFIGHVDAGKSTMGGNILYLCGMVDKRTLEKYEREAKEAGRESWYLSWALDSTSQEREKGKTVEVGRAYFETDARRYTILDAPGHKNYVPAMISGAAQADVAILVISARKGEFETGFEKGGQTREHAMLVKTAGITKLVVVVNKMDDPTVNWDKERYDEIVTKLSPFLKGSGYNLKTDVVFIPVSGFTGANLKENVDRKVASWVEGVSLLNYLDTMELMDRKNNAPLMIPISEKYSDMGTIIVGKIESGQLRKGSNLVLMPNKNAVSVSAIYNELEEEIDAAYCGDNIRVRLRGVEDDEISTGFVLTSPKAPVHTVTQFEAQLVILDHKNIITAGYGAIMHVHTLSEEVTLNALLHYYDKKTGRKSRRPPQFAKKGMKVIALLETTAPVCVEKFSEHPQLGRFTLRDEGKTVAIGKITKLIESADDLPDVAKLSVDA
ncbi:translation termination factor GTPase eRF3 [Microbotryomycetes sp. JL221]|nr:translation termination factor GTPase eRF3 [Microbotryomycetes sp. JL221]